MTHLNWFADPLGPGQFLMRDQNPQAPVCGTGGNGRLAARPIAVGVSIDRARSEDG
jgi:hypothetical protein